MRRLSICPGERAERLALGLQYAQVITFLEPEEFRLKQSSQRSASKAARVTEGKVQVCVYVCSGGHSAHREDER